MFWRNSTTASVKEAMLPVNQNSFLTTTKSSWYPLPMIHIHLARLTAGGAELEWTFHQKVNMFSHTFPFSGIWLLFSIWRSRADINSLLKISPSSGSNFCHISALPKRSVGFSDGTVPVKKSGEAFYRSIWKRSPPLQLLVESGLTQELELIPSMMTSENPPSWAKMKSFRSRTKPESNQCDSGSTNFCSRLQNA